MPLSGVDYCNCVLSSAPNKAIDKLQHVQNIFIFFTITVARKIITVQQNATARLVRGTRKYERGQSQLMHWLDISQRVTELQGRYLAVPVSEVLIASICDLPDVINCQFHKFAVAPLRPVHFLSPDQQSGIHCLISCGIHQLLTPNNLGGS